MKFYTHVKKDFRIVMAQKSSQYNKRVLRYNKKRTMTMGAQSFHIFEEKR